MVPKRGHLIWIGKKLPYAYVLAARSAAKQGGLDEVVFHHTDDLSGTHWWDTLTGTPGLQAQRLDAAALLRDTDTTGRLARLWERSPSLAAKSDIARMAILFREGGVYLDTDTLTHRPLAPVCDESDAFCGEERLVFPKWVRESWNPKVKVRAYSQTAMRSLLAKLPGGWRGFQRIERFYPRAINNAVLGSAPGHAFPGIALERMKSMADAKLGPFSLGPHLLMDIAHDVEGLKVHPADVFYPLSSEIAAQWFRKGTGRHARAMATADNRVIHWYASVSTRKVIDQMTPTWIRTHATSVAFCALAEASV